MSANSYSDYLNTLHGRTIKCGNCGSKHATVHDVRDCYDLTTVLEAYVAEQQADYLAELDHGDWVS